MIKPKLTEVAKEFWSRIPLDRNPPFDIFGAVSLAMPLNIVSLSRLTLDKIQNWLFDRNVTLNLEMNNRSLHGFLLTYRDTGFIFIDGTDSVEDRRFTVAHEVSHFILDYRIPREKAIAKFGVEILEVLDGYRDASTAERLKGVLSFTCIKPFTHLLERSGDGSFFNENIYNSENDADSLALELLAPAARIIHETRDSLQNVSFNNFKNKCTQLLFEKYGLPTYVSNIYATRLAYSITGGPSLLSKFGF